MSICLVTGAAGFIGSSITSALIAQGNIVRGLDDLSSGFRANLAHLSEGLEFTEGDVRDEALLDRLCAGVDVIFHQAAIASVQKSVEDPMGTFSVNVEGTQRLIAAARKAGVRRIVFASSSAVYGEVVNLPVDETTRFAPMSPYAAHKLNCELMLAEAQAHDHLETVCLRYFNVFGPRQSASSPYSGVIARFLNLMLQPGSKTRVTIFGDGSHTRDFVFIDDVVEANLAAAFAPAERVSGYAFNIGGGKATSVLEMARQIAELTGHKGKIFHEAAREGDVPHSLADIHLAMDRLEYDPKTTLENGLKSTISWLRRNAEVLPKQGAGPAVRMPPQRSNASQSVAQAISKGEFSLVYQPIVQLPSGRISGVEALLRHAHEDPTRAPIRLIRLAEATGAIVELGAWVLDAACRDASRLMQAIGPKMRLSVNVSMPQLEDTGFAAMVEQALSRSGLKPQTLELEITERVLLSQRRFARQGLRQLKDLGVQVALDDFGCGYANLQQLCRLHVDRLKTDRSILRSSSKRWPLFDGVVAFAKSLKLPLVAEGVETQGQLEKVMRARCEEAQGYLFSQPIRVDDLVARSSARAEVA